MRILPILLCLLATSAQAKITVVTSILPLQKITAAIMQGTGELELLIKSQSSAHHFAFKPSHIRALKRADLVIWIDRKFESGFQQLPDLLQDSTVQLELLPAIGAVNEDGHIWYSPQLLYRVIEEISKSLIELAPQHRDTFQRNQTKLRQAIAEWARSMREQIVIGKPRYLLDHNFLAHLENSFDLKAVATINDDHDQHGGIRALRLIEQRLASGSAKCLLSNETSVSKIGKNLAEKYDLKIVLIEGFSEQENIETGFMQHLWQLHDRLMGCR